jgi:hypothetical protein
MEGQHYYLLRQDWEFEAKLRKKKPGKEQRKKTFFSRALGLTVAHR